MFDWEKEQIKQTRKLIEKNNKELQLVTKEQLLLEKNSKVKTYLELMENPEIQRYLSLKVKRDLLMEDISNKKAMVDNLKQSICLHHTLLFISDVTTEYDRSIGVENYRCMCMDCGAIVKLQFIDGKRNCTTLIDIGKISEDKLEKIRTTYIDLKDKNLYRDEIIQILTDSFGKGKVRKLRNIEFL